jgi:hypothetical protein
MSLFPLVIKNKIYEKQKTKLKVGDKVQCIDAVPRSGTLKGGYDYPDGFLKHGKIYTVSDISSFVFAHKDYPLGLRHFGCVYLKEISSIRKTDGTKTPFLRYRFRKI